MRRLLAILAALLAMPLAGCATTVPAADLGAAIQGATFNRQGDYLIGANDQLAVKVYGQDALSGTYAVAPSGVLVFPLVGFVQAEGLTAHQVTERLQTALRPYVKSPLVTVVVARRDSFQIYLTGAVARPGAVMLQTRTSLLQGLALAGGLTSKASGRVVVVRQVSPGVFRRYATTHDALLAGRGGVDRFVLERGDVVHAE